MIDSYRPEPFMQYYRRRVYQMGWRAGQRPNSHQPAAQARWENRWAGQPESFCLQDWLDGFRDGQKLGRPIGN
jgi:hypothetical protein